MEENTQLIENTGKQLREIASCLEALRRHATDDLQPMLQRLAVEHRELEQRQQHLAASCQRADEQDKTVFGEMLQVMYQAVEQLRKDCARMVSLLSGSG